MSDDRAQLQVRIPVALRQRLRDVTEQRVVSMSFIVTRALTKYLDELEGLP